jgi:hypothetical protein
VKTNDIKKGTEVKTVQLGTPVSGVMMDNLKGNIRMIKTHGSEVGLFDEIGSIYATDIILAKNSDGKWEDVEHTDKQTQAQSFRSLAGF